MKKMIAALMVLFVLSAALIGCKSKPKDSDLKAAIETALQSNPAASGVMVSVEKGVATLTGQVASEESKQTLDKTAAGVLGVKSIVNDITVTPPSIAPVVVAAEDALTTAVKDATKDFPTVTATVSDGVVTLKGEIQKTNLQKLMMSLQALKPKKVDNSQLVIK